MKRNEGIILMAATALVLGGFSSVACESKVCRDVVDNDPQKNLAIHNRCVFGVDSYGEPVKQKEALFPLCGFYVNTDPAFYVKTYTEAEILDRKLNARLNELVYLVRAKDISDQEQEGWLRKKSVPTLLEIYRTKEDNAIDAQLPSSISLKKRSNFTYDMQVVFENKSKQERSLFFKPLEYGNPFAPAVEIRELKTGRRKTVYVELSPLSYDQAGYVTDQVLFKGIGPGAKYRLHLVLNIQDGDEMENQFTAVINYSIRKNIESGSYWTCASPVTFF